MKVNLGSGPARKENGVVNVDVYPFAGVDIVHDIEKDLPFESNSIDSIYSSHSLEHCSHYKVDDILKECHRILKPGGSLRLIVPDVIDAMKRFLEVEDSERWGWRAEYIWGGQDKQVGQQLHKTGFTKERLTRILTSLGFRITSIASIDNGRNNCIHLTAIKE
jgi:ubiquinone/menaquinone biosynthesis C-methylase UbiE